MQARTKKQVILGLLLVTGLTLGLAVSGLAAADKAAPPAPPASTTDRMSSPAPDQPGQVGPHKHAKGHKDPAMQAKMEKFLEETRALRRQLVSKRDAHIALMHAAQPNIAQIQQISGELFDLREDLMSKAKAAGLPPRAAMAGLHGFGCGHHRHGHHHGPGHGGHK